MKNYLVHKLCIVLLGFSPIQTLYAQDFGFREIKAPFEENYVFFELFGMIYEEGTLTDITLSASVNDENLQQAKTFFLLFPKGKEFHYGNTDSLAQMGIKKAALNFDDWTAYRIDDKLKAYIDNQWLEDVRGELYFYVIWDIMADYGELDSKRVVFTVEGDFDYKDKNILSRSGVEGSYTDTRDQQKYKIVTIGDAVWMKENLRFHAAFSKKKHDVIEKTKDGIKYSWWNARKACPVGWRLPETSDFMYLKSFYQNQRHLLPGGVSSLDLKSIFYDEYWVYWSSTPSETGYINTFQFEWEGLEKKANKAGGSYAEQGEWAKSLIRCVKE